MPSNRTQLKIITDVLKTARDDYQEEGICISAVIGGGKLPHNRLNVPVASLVQHDLLEEIGHEKGKRYKMGLEGWDFCRHILVSKNSQGLSD